MKTRIAWCGILPALFAAACLGPDGDDGLIGDLHAPQSTLIVELPAFVESDHPYPNRQDREWWVSAPADALRLILPFDRLETEWGYDYVLIYAGSDELVAILTGSLDEVEVTVPGPQARIRLVTDGSVRRFGLQLTHFFFEKPAPVYTDHRPVCRQIGSLAEGWYWADSGALVATGRCGAVAEPSCAEIGSRSEGWYTDAGLLVWDQCHRTVRIALGGEACGPSIGFDCYAELYCAGLPGEGMIGGSGTCLPLGACQTTADCSAEGNQYPAPACVGQPSCEQGACVWHCAGEPVEQTDFHSSEALDIPDADPTGVASELFVSNLPHCSLEVHVDVDIRHSYIGDLRVRLSEPGGVELVLHDRAGGSADDLHLAAVAWPQDFTKEGAWRLQVSDHYARDVGTLDGWALHFSCRD